jgi:hypothetical protein
MDETRARERHCQAVTADGEICQATPKVNGFCWFHDPDAEAAQARQESRAKGGKSRRYEDIPAKPDGTPGTMQDIVDGLGAEIRAVLADMDNSPARAHALRGLYASLADVLESMGMERLEAELGIGGERVE